MQPTLEEFRRAYERRGLNRRYSEEAVDALYGYYQDTLYDDDWDPMPSDYWTEHYSITEAADYYGFHDTDELRYCAEVVDVLNTGRVLVTRDLL